MSTSNEKDAGSNAELSAEPKTKEPTPTSKAGSKAESSAQPKTQDDGSVKPGSIQKSKDPNQGAKATPDTEKGSKSAPPTKSNKTGSQLNENKTSSVSPSVKDGTKPPGGDSNNRKSATNALSKETKKSVAKQATQENQNKSKVSQDSQNKEGVKDKDMSKLGTSKGNESQNKKSDASPSKSSGEKGPQSSSKKTEAQKNSKLLKTKTPDNDRLEKKGPNGSPTNLRRKKDGGKSKTKEGKVKRAGSRKGKQKLQTSDLTLKDALTPEQLTLLKKQCGTGKEAELKAVVKTVIIECDKPATCDTPARYDKPAKRDDCKPKCPWSSRGESFVVCPPPTPPPKLPPRTNCPPDRIIILRTSSKKRRRCKKNRCVQTETSMQEIENGVRKTGGDEYRYSESTTNQAYSDGNQHGSFRQKEGKCPPECNNLPPIGRNLRQEEGKCSPECNNLPPIESNHRQEERKRSPEYNNLPPIGRNLRQEERNCSPECNNRPPIGRNLRQEEENCSPECNNLPPIGRNHRQEERKRSPKYNNLPPIGRNLRQEEGKCSPESRTPRFSISSNCQPEPSISSCQSRASLVSSMCTSIGVPSRKSSRSTQVSEPLRKSSKSTVTDDPPRADRPSSVYSPRPIVSESLNNVKREPMSNKSTQSSEHTGSWSPNNEKLEPTSSNKSTQSSEPTRSSSVRKREPQRNVSLQCPNAMSPGNRVNIANPTRSVEVRNSCDCSQPIAYTRISRRCLIPTQSCPSKLRLCGSATRHTFPSRSRDRYPYY